MLCKEKMLLRFLFKFIQMTLPFFCLVFSCVNNLKVIPEKSFILCINGGSSHYIGTTKEHQASKGHRRIISMSHDSFIGSFTTRLNVSLVNSQKNKTFYKIMIFRFRDSAIDLPWFFWSVKHSLNYLPSWSIFIRIRRHPFFLWKKKTFERVNFCDNVDI